MSLPPWEREGSLLPTIYINILYCQNDPSPDIQRHVCTGIILERSKNWHVHVFNTTKVTRTHIISTPEELDDVCFRANIPTPFSRCVDPPLMSVLRIDGGFLFLHETNCAKLGQVIR